MYKHVFTVFTDNELDKDTDILHIVKCLEQAIAYEVKGNIVVASTLNQTVPGTKDY